MPELIDEYLVRIYKLPLWFKRETITCFIDEMVYEKGWDFVREDEVVDGIRLKFTKSPAD